MPGVCHAFTLEMPEMVCRLMEDFVMQVLENRYPGDGKVFIAAEEPGETLYFLCPGDHTRAIPVLNPPSGESHD